MIFALTNKGQLRWTTFNAPLDAKTLLAFLRRLDIEAFPLPARRAPAG